MNTVSSPLMDFCYYEIPNFPRLSLVLSRLFVRQIMVSLSLKGTLITTSFLKMISTVSWLWNLLSQLVWMTQNCFRSAVRSPKLDRIFQPAWWRAGNLVRPKNQLTSHWLELVDLKWFNESMNSRIFIRAP